MSIPLTTEENDIVACGERGGYLDQYISRSNPNTAAAIALLMSGGKLSEFCETAMLIRTAKMSPDPLAVLMRKAMITQVVANYVQRHEVPGGNKNHVLYKVGKTTLLDFVLGRLPNPGLEAMLTHLAGVAKVPVWSDETVHRFVIWSPPLLIIHLEGLLAPLLANDAYTPVSAISSAKKRFMNWWEDALQRQLQTGDSVTGKFKNHITEVKNGVHMLLQALVIQRGVMSVPCDTMPEEVNIWISTLQGSLLRLYRAMNPAPWHDHLTYIKLYQSSIEANQVPAIPKIVLERLNLIAAPPTSKRVREESDGPITPFRGRGGDRGRGGGRGRGRGGDRGRGRGHVTTDTIAPTAEEDE